MRADSGLFAEELLEFLEERSLADVIAARLTNNFKARVAGLSTWPINGEDFQRMALVR